MATKFTIEQAATIAEVAFLPLRCASEFVDRRNKLRLSILDADDEPAIPSTVLVGGQFRDARRLKSNLSQLRRLIEKRRKINLAPWKFPEPAAPTK